MFRHLNGRTQTHRATLDPIRIVSGQTLVQRPSGYGCPSGSQSRFFATAFEVTRLPHLEKHQNQNFQMKERCQQQTEHDPLTNVRSQTTHIQHASLGKPVSLHLLGSFQPSENNYTMSGRGKGGKGLGKGGAKRHRKVLRDNIQGVSFCINIFLPDFCCLVG